MKDLARIFAELTDPLAAGATLLLLSDYDGTLTPLVADPAAAGLAREVRDDLRLLAGSPVVRVGILSGRALDDIRARVGVPEIIYAGCHGLEIEGPGLAFRHPGAEALRWMLAAIAEALRIRAASIPGVRVEAKGLAVAVHYRNVAPAALARLEILFERVIHPRRSKLRLFRGKKVIEILPRVGWNKGECGLWIRDRICPTVPSDVAILYMGDDRTDEVAFDVLSGKATTVRVGPGPSLSAAKYRLPDVPDVHRLLSALAAEVRGRR
ncbi:MAG: trehalose-phosphatase [Candidatus Rokubacteria bacterium]|nr:trehalose-phosphatase [Candidatus Rokubacteria bacterium]